MQPNPSLNIKHTLMQTKYTSFASAINATVRNVKQVGGIVVGDDETVSQRLKDVNVTVGDLELNEFYAELEAKPESDHWWNEWMEFVEAVIVELDMEVTGYEQY